MARSLIDPDAGHVYVAEQAAFEGTILDERPGFNSLLDEAHSLTSSGWWSVQTKGYGTVEFERIRSNSLGGDASPALREVRFASNAKRFVVAHELAHILHGARSLSGDAHGLNFRNVYVIVTGRLYGPQYARELWSSFTDHSLRTSFTDHTLRTTAPLVDIDAIGGVVTGGWQRPS